MACAGVFFNKVAGLRHKCFSVNFAKKFKNTFFNEQLRSTPEYIYIFIRMFCTFVLILIIVLSFRWLYSLVLLVWMLLFWQGEFQDLLKVTREKWEYRVDNFKKDRILICWSYIYCTVFFLLGILVKGGELISPV